LACAAPQPEPLWTRAEVEDRFDALELRLVRGRVACNAHWGERLVLTLHQKPTHREDFRSVMLARRDHE
jgi:hypothetical protein